ncbi:MAG: hypothetical protein DRQ51_09810 [Gammaproteobacteria bacterium]|nr:MAG: hypothetical protein DRQ51_09810 [Gammaproteobacteria bacterium]
MSLSFVNARAQSGIKSPQVIVETHITGGMPYFSVVGMPETAVKESKDRVRSAIINSGFEFPFTRIIINLAPADLPKEGGRYDLSIAIGILSASNQINTKNIANYDFIGELSLSGAVRAVSGILPSAIAASTDKRDLIIPVENASEASLIKNLTVQGAKHLLDVVALLNDNRQLTDLDSHHKCNT